MRAAGAALVAALALGSCLGSAMAQSGDPVPVVVASPILTIDQDRAYAGSAFGRRVGRDLDARAADLAAENRRIEAELTAEELALTEARATLPPDEFQRRADAFDARVVAIRAAQDAKSRALGGLRDAARDVFWRDSLPALGQILAERGAVAILDRRVVFLAANVIDVTDDAVARIDAVLGEGPGLDTLLPPPDPDTAPETGGTP